MGHPGSSEVEGKAGPSTSVGMTRFSVVLLGGDWFEVEMGHPGFVEILEVDWMGFG